MLPAIFYHLLEPTVRWQVGQAAFWCADKQAGQQRLAAMLQNEAFKSGLSIDKKSARWGGRLGRRRAELDASRAILPKENALRGLSQGAIIADIFSSAQLRLSNTCQIQQVLVWFPSAALLPS